MAIDPDRLKKLEKQMGMLMTHPVLSKFLQGGPLAVPEGGMLLGGRRIVGGAPVVGQALIWNALLRAYAPQDIPGGIVTFLGLADTPSSYSGQALLGVRVNAAATGLEFFAAAGGHDPVTLAVDVQELLDLSTQELGLVAKAANLILAGPASGGAVDPTFRAMVKADLPTLKVSKSLMFHYPDEDLAVGDFVSESAIRVPAAGKHGVITPGTIYARCTVVGTGVNTVLFRTSSTLTGARTVRGVVSLADNREASGVITWTPVSGEYMWVDCSVVGGTAPKRVVAQVDLEEAVY